MKDEVRGMGKTDANGALDTLNCSIYANETYSSQTQCIRCPISFKNIPYEKKAIQYEAMYRPDYSLPGLC